MPVTLTLTDEQWHDVLRQAVYVASSLEAYLEDLRRGADPRRDAWVLAASVRLHASVSAQDKLLELLHDAQARPVPDYRPSRRPVGRASDRGGRPTTTG